MADNGGLSLRIELGRLASDDRRENRGYDA